MSLTFVTALYDLSKLEPGRRPLSDYLEKGKSWREKKINVVVFTEEAYSDPSYYPENSKIIILPFSTLPDHALMNDGVKRLIPPHPKDTPNYFVLMSSKFYFLQEAIKLDPFKSTHFAWLDYGIAHVANTNRLDTLILSNKIKLANFEVISTNDKLYPIPGYHSHIESRVACGMFVGSKQNIMELCTLFQQTYSKWLQEDIVGLEGWVMTKLVAMNPDKFHLYPGDYAQIISNFNYVTDNIGRCLDLARGYFRNTDFTRAMMLYSSFIELGKEGIRLVTPLTSEQLYHYLVNFYSTSLWISPDLAYASGNMLVNLALQLPSLSKLVVHNYNILYQYFDLAVLPNLGEVKITVSNPSNTVKAMEEAMKLSRSKLVTVVMEGVEKEDIRRFKVANPRYLEK